MKYSLIALIVVLVPLANSLVHGGSAAGGRVALHLFGFLVGIGAGYVGYAAASALHFCWIVVHGIHSAMDSCNRDEWEIIQFDVRDRRNIEVEARAIHYSPE